MSDPRSTSTRRVVNIYNKSAYRPYDLEGEMQEDMSYIDLTMNIDGDGNGAYLIRMEPGAETIPHIHAGNEDYLILEGDLIESDGTTYGVGDFIHYDPGTHHNSRTVGGCLLIGVDWNRRTPENEVG